MRHGKHRAPGHTRDEIIVAVLAFALAAFVIWMALAKPEWSE